MDLLENFNKPSWLDDVTEDVGKFIRSFMVNGADKVVLLTSGGTAVPFEQNTIRYLDNFSSGCRGASSAEQFLKKGYFVIFLHRKGSLCPFQRFLPDSYALLSSLTTEFAESDMVKISFLVENNVKIISALNDMNAYKHKLKLVSYFTVDEYIFLLKNISCLLKPYGPRVVLYLAAAVSDYYIPYSSLPEHKIQSKKEDLVVCLKPTPKVVKHLMHDWVHGAYVVTFKLETDEKILIQKSYNSLQSHGNHVVIGNMLESRKRKVIVITDEGEQLIELQPQDSSNGVEVEEPLINRLSDMHEQFLKNATN